MLTALGGLLPLGIVADITRVLGSRFGFFGLGLATPLTAVCVLPLYPGFVAYLASHEESRTGTRGYTPVWLIGGLIGLGVIAFMTILGVIFSTVLQQGIPVDVVSPIAFAVLGLFSLVLVADADVAAAFPSIEPPQTDHPYSTAFGYGFFFGAIIIPCNPGIPALFLSRALLYSNPVSSVLNFVTFGLGIVFPLFALAVLSDRFSQTVIGFMTRHRSAINRTTGAAMFVIAVYYLVFVFKVLPTY